MLVRELMNKTVSAVRPETTLLEVAPLLESGRTSAAVVVDERRRPLGIVTSSDLMPLERALEPDPNDHPGLAEALWGLLRGGGISAADYQHAHGHRVSDVMSSPVITITPDDTVSHAITTMNKHHIGQLPVVSLGKLAGILGRRELIHRVTLSLGAVHPAPAVDDADLATKLDDAFQRAPWHISGRVRVDVRNSVIHLTGSLKKAEDRRAVELLAEQVAPGYTIVNDLIYYHPHSYSHLHHVDEFFHRQHKTADQEKVNQSEQV